MARRRVTHTFIYLFILIPGIVGLALRADASPGLRVLLAEFKPLDKSTAVQLSHTKQAIEALTKLHKLIEDDLVTIDEEEKTAFLKKVSSLESQLREQFEGAISQHVEPLKAEARITSPGRNGFTVENLKVLYFGLEEYPGGPIDKSGGENITREVQFSPLPPFRVEGGERISVLITFQVDTRLFLESQIESIAGVVQTATMGEYRIRAKLSNGVEISREFRLDAKFVDGELRKDFERVSTNTYFVRPNP